MDWAIEEVAFPMKRKKEKKKEDVAYRPAGGRLLDESERDCTSLDFCEA